MTQSIALRCENRRGERDDSFVGHIVAQVLHLNLIWRDASPHGIECIYTTDNKLLGISPAIHVSWTPCQRHACHGHRTFTKRSLPLLQHSRLQRQSLPQQAHVAGNELEGRNSNGRCWWQSSQKGLSDLDILIMFAMIFPVKSAAWNRTAGRLG